jgi:hypothetical protein
MKNLVSSQFADSFPWYWLFHMHNKFEDNLDCPLTIYAVPDGNSSAMIINAYEIR